MFGFINVLMNILQRIVGYMSNIVKRLRKTKPMEETTRASSRGPFDRIKASQYSGFLPITSAIVIPPTPVIVPTTCPPTNKCVILCPCNGGIEPKTDQSLRVLESMGYEVWRVPGWSCISQARSKITYDAIYRRKFEEVLWIDSDIMFNPTDVARIRSHNLPIVGAAYSMKGWPVMTFAPINDKEIIFDEVLGGLTEVKALATGFLFIKAEVFHTIKEKLNLPICNTSFSSETIPFFRPQVWEENGQYFYLGEDFSFCYSAVKCGYKMILDSKIKLGHIGKYVYEWADIINQTGKVPELNSNTPLVYKDLNLVTLSNSIKPA